VSKSDHLPVGTTLVVEPMAPPLSRAEPDASVQFTVVYEDAHLLVVDKPAGLVVHPAKGHPRGTLVNGLLARGGFEADNADPRDPEGHLRPGIVHRLDKDTSGLLVIAKDAATREGLKALLAKHDVERAYLAIVQGRAVAAEYDTSHGRHPKSRLKFTSLLADGTLKRARTRVEIVEGLPDATLVRCILWTGRTHQIRVHLAEQGKTPILADALYGTRPPQPTLREVAAELGRQALHATVLGFVHPASGERMHFDSPLPDDMAGALARLRA
jgi:23S rRNA pseudouridine1911/1915/1917 synthase